jgi:hypothetical protein
MQYTFTKPVTLDNQLIEEIIETAGYGIGYWAHSGHNDKLAETYAVTWDGEDFADSDPNSAGKRVLTYEDIAKAVEGLNTGEAKAGDWLIKQLAEWLNGEPTMDTDLADVIIQVALFDEIIYG